MRRMSYLLAALAILGAFQACRKDDTPGNGEELTDEEAKMRTTVNTFAYNAMNTYYLWNEEVADSLATWRLTEEPKDKVKRTRYSDAAGKEIDHWTTLTDDYTSFVGSTTGVGTTYGLDFKVYYYDSSRTSVCMVVTLTYPDSPARNAGLARGDIIVKVNGKTMTPDNYIDIIYDEFLYASSCTLTERGGKEYSMSAVEMYEDPVLVHQVIELGSRKIGYLFYNRFTPDSCSKLIEVGKEFKAAGIDELILDMRYNPGGYVSTEVLLASLLAPEAEVLAGSVFEKEIYNSILTQAWGSEDRKFSTTHTISSKIYDVSGANFGVSKIYAILTGSSASAAESLLVGLMPYVDIKIFGEQSSGKYCSGIIYSAKDWYSDYADQLKDEQKKLGDKYAEDWGIYVMIGRYADKNGNTPCMPDGFTPDIVIYDDPTESIELGDLSEEMLSASIAYILTGDIPSKATKSSERMVELPFELPGRDGGIRIVQPARGKVLLH